MVETPRTQYSTSARRVGHAKREGSVSLQILRKLGDLRHETKAWRDSGLTYALVPTMGALHEGHLTLVRRAMTRADRVLVSIFVNPKQFGPDEDLNRYPRDEDSDVAMLMEAGAALVYAPPHELVYPQNHATTVSLAGPAKANLEDKFRPHFFDGVATVVAKLFISTAADIAMFGEKDYQQFLVVRRMAADLDMPIEVICVPTARAEDGLALSSRNRYLSKAERHQASALYKALSQAAERIKSGIPPQKATRTASRSLSTLGFKVDYFTARNADSLAVPKDPSGEPLRLLAAAWLGSTRLIDNIAV
jgi:pantoate--beta-alanine ligase